MGQILNDAPSPEQIIIGAICVAMIAAAFGYCVYVNLRLLPRKISSPWHRIGLGALPFCFLVAITLLILFCLWDEALSEHRTHVAQVIGTINMVLVYMGLFALGLSVFALLGGMVVRLLKRSSAPLKSLGGEVTFK